MPGAIKVPDFIPQPLLKHHDASVLDLAFVMDCTGSMSSYINEARKNIQNIVEEIVAKEMSDIHLAMVEYRDHPPQDSSFVTRVMDFTPSLKNMQKTMDKMSASGGGDGPEAVADGLHKALNLKWRPGATKVCVLIADAPPHGLGDGGDGFPKGCPAGHDPMKISRKMAEKNITLYSVACGSYAEGFKDFFMAIAHVTGGQYVALKDANLLSKVIIGGAREEMSLQQLMDEVNHEVMQEFHARGGTVDEDAMATRVETTLKKRKRTAKTMTTGTDALPEISKRSKRIAELESMADVRSELARPDTTPPTSPGGTTTPAKKAGTGRKRKLGADVTTSKKKARKSKHVIFSSDSDDEEVAQTRSRSRHPVTGVCAICSASTSLHLPSSPPKVTKTKPRKRTPTPRPAIRKTTKTAKTARSTKKAAVVSSSTDVAKPTPSTVYGDIAVLEGASVSTRQVRRLVKKSIAVNKLKK
ncbi:uncharacterized protein [Ptychodera flava]|uniref:uncharacterized protein isoform X2 n=1 Tax=Ptychodera flava TaxID=63121 RepID=UPI003969C035